MHESIADLACRHASLACGPAHPRLLLHISREPSLPVPTLYRPMLGIVLRGAKRVTIGDRTLHYDPDHYFIGAIHVPAEVAIIEASPQLPYVAARLTIDPDMLTDLVADIAVDTAKEDDGDTTAFAVGAMTPELRDAMGRMLRLLDAPGDIDPFGPLVEREILLRILRGPQGAVLRQAARSDSRIAQIRQAVAHLRENFSRTIRMEELAAICAMSMATFNRHFKAATAMSPLQYQKTLRLHEARRLLAADRDVAGTGYAVGYESASQFNREYSRMFGTPPGRDAARLRGR